MKTLKLLSMCIAFSSFSMMQSCSAQSEGNEMAENTMGKTHKCNAKCCENKKCDFVHGEAGHTCNSDCSGESTSSKTNDGVVKSQTITFTKGKLYELAFADIKPEKMEQLNNEYFPKAMPLMAKYGAKMLGGFGVVKNESEMLASNMVAIFEWPNAQARLNLLADKEFQKIVHLRDEALNTVQLGYFEVKEDKNVTFRSDKVYEMGAANLAPGEEGKKALDEYFKVSEPIKRSYGGTYPEFVLNFSPVDSKGQATYTPHMQFIVEWDSLKDNEKLFANEEFKTKAIPLLNKAVEKFDAVFTKFSFSE
ncbi:MAG: DUF1330 domain-containing protein [Flavobacteriales bacterium]|nr:DUF1330 domain-containing protein [Flavobacteriales bacterium]